MRSLSIAMMGTLAMIGIATGAHAQNKCQGAKIKDAGKKASCVAGLQSKVAAAGGTIDPAKLAKCQAKVSAAYAKLEAKPGCNTTGDSTAIENKVDAFTTDLNGELNVGGGTTTTSTTSSGSTSTTTPTTTTTTTTICPIVCSAMCVDPSNDPVNCGSCGHVCPAGASCVSGVCTCPAGDTNCGVGLGCVDTSTDPDNCGACGSQCPPGAVCSAGVCSCPAGDVNCGGLVGCVDTANDPNHCGSCINACPTGDSCVSGACTCPAGNVMCGTVCTDLATDPSHCGNCANACPQGDTCTAGTCSCSGTLCSSSVCADLQNSPDNCSSCGTGCTASQACLSSACTCRPGLTLCSGQCLDLLHDPNNCGSCGTVCNAATPRCVDGICQATTCGAIGRTACSGGCYTLAQLASSPLHCSNISGVCGSACPADQVCAQGTCAAFFTSTACTTCPCPACGTGTVCCSYPGTTEPICVQGTACPS